MKAGWLIAPLFTEVVAQVVQPDAIQISEDGQAPTLRGGPQ
jgi:hypothetical protein